MSPPAASVRLPIAAYTRQLSIVNVQPLRGEFPVFQVPPLEILTLSSATIWAFFTVVFHVQLPETVVVLKVIEPPLEILISPVAVTSPSTSVFQLKSALIVEL